MFRLLATFALVAAATASDRVAFETDATHPAETDQWLRGARAGSNDEMTVTVMLKHDAADVSRLEEKLFEVSDPSSPSYGMHLTLEEVGAFAPIAKDKAMRVAEFLSTASSASASLNPNGDIVTATLTVEDAERLFDTEIRVYHHKMQDDVKILRAAMPYTLPSEVADAVSIVGDLISLPRLKDNKAAASEAVTTGAGQWPNACASLSGCKGLITPAVLLERYSVPNSTDDSNAEGNGFAVAEFQGQYYEQKDLDAFSAACGMDVSVDTVIGGDKQSAGVESELDVEYIKGVSPHIPLTVIYSEQFSLLDWMTSVSKMTNPPLVHSVSYGNDEKQQTSTAYMESCNTQFMKAGVRGLSILFASGDQGVCGREGCGFLKKRFKPDFPGASPYVTTVGGTDFKTTSIGEETAWTGSGGGFSDTFAIPSWQATAVAAYKARSDNKLPAQSLWNNTGRGYPDISALGGQKTPYCVVTGGQAEGVAGTSAACPVASSIFARLNGVQLKAGKKPLGFLNPFIYQNAAAFNDVTSGINTGGSISSTAGFTATVGWDPATGVGTPNYAKLVAALP